MMQQRSLIQLDFFGNDEEIKIKNKVKSLETDIKDIGSSSDKVRRGIFARCNEVQKLCKELESRLNIIESHICKS